MSNNTTHFLLKPSNTDIEAKYDSFALYVVNMSVLIPIAALSPVAMIANGLVMAAIWRNLSLRTKPINVTRSRTFSRVSCLRHVLASSFDWLTRLSLSFVIGQSNDFCFGFTTLK